MAFARSQKPHVVIVGGGFGGLTAAKALEGDRVQVTLVDRTNHHLFQPLLYQVATAGLSPAEIAQPIRSVLSAQENATVLMADVLGVDLAAKTVTLDHGVLSYDYLILATGARTTYFGHPEWEAHAPGLKSVEDALEIRRRVLLAFETAEREKDAKERARLLTFVVIGGGPTGVELAGALAELAQQVVAGDFRAIVPREARVVLVEAGERVLSAFTEGLSQNALEQLRDGLRVEVVTKKRVTAIDERGIELDGKDRIPAATVVWGAGVEPNPLGRSLGVPLDRQGRVVVEADLSLPGHADAFAIGDMARVEQDGQPLPGVSPVAMQEARAAAKNVLLAMDHQERIPFRYWDKGTMATIGRSRAVLMAGRLQMTGFVAWLGWLVIHIWYLIGFRSRLVVLITWAWSYFTYRRGARLIVGRGWKPTSTDAPTLAGPSGPLRDFVSEPSPDTASSGRRASHDGPVGELFHKP